jgi:hypothetical protein
MTKYNFEKEMREYRERNQAFHKRIDDKLEMYNWLMYSTIVLSILLTIIVLAF